MPNLDELIKKLEVYEKNPDIELVRCAYSFAEVAHLGQKRLSGEDFLQHPLAVADLLTEVRADSTTIAAALLHDVLEKSNLSKESLAEEFGAEITSLVGGLTAVKAASDKSETGKDKDWEDLRGLMLSTIHDPRVLAIRLAEKIHNLRTSSFLPEDKQKIAAQKVFDIWGPLSALFGFYFFKAELEDRAFAVLEPEKYQEIEKLVTAESKKMEAVILEVKQKLAVELGKENISAQIAGRRKHLYGVNRKLSRYESAAGGKFFDILGLRVVVGTVEECYRVLDVVRHLWKEVPELFDDYIAHPKPNGYRSLHTVFSIEEYLVEIQIRTKEMNDVAEFGLAAHPLYKERGSGPAEEKISLLKSLVVWEKGQELDLFPDKVFVFTPMGDVKVLPTGATAVDFAYAVHDEIGNNCSGAKVNGKIVQLNYQLKTGEVVEVLTTKGKKPSSDWLGFAKTEKARSEIGKMLR